MRRKNHICPFFISLVSLLILGFSVQDIQAQEVKKNKLRINAQYVKISNGESYFDIKASARVEKKNVAVSGIEINVSNTSEGGQIELGKTVTNHNGKTKFILKDFNALNSDTTGIFNIVISFKGNEMYTRAKRSISFRDVNLSAAVVVKDSINYIKARLTDVDDNPIAELPLKIEVQRLIRNYLLGKEFNLTDENGGIFVPIEEQFPGVEGKLIFEVVLDENDDFGTVKTLVEANIGIPIVDESTFNERTMWSTRDKTPIFLLIFPNILIIGTWGLILYLIINLFKISKAKT
ncbi:MAG: hypothetical protein ACI81Y_002801 [Glaciecola sp.]|jgi:hypothetical protein